MSQLRGQLNFGFAEETAEEAVIRCESALQAAGDEVVVSVGRQGAALQKLLQATAELGQAVSRLVEIKTSK